jgi:hypothetical protein
MSASACCSFVIALPHKRKNPAQWPGLVCGACRSLRSHLSKMGTFYRWILLAAS